MGAMEVVEAVERSVERSVSFSRSKHRWPTWAARCSRLNKSKAKVADAGKGQATPGHAQRERERVAPVLNLVPSPSPRACSRPCLRICASRPTFISSRSLRSFCGRLRISTFYFQRVRCHFAKQPSPRRGRTLALSMCFCFVLVGKLRLCDLTEAGFALALPCNGELSQFRTTFGLGP